MKQDRRRSLKLAITGGFLARWTTPSIVAASLPSHAQTSFCDPLDAISYEGFFPSNIQCVVGNPNRITFDLLNDSGSNLTFTMLNSSNDSQTHISPPFPFDMAVGETLSFVVESTLDSIPNCPDLGLLGYSVENDMGCSGSVPITI